MNKIKVILHKMLALSPGIYWYFYAIRYYFQIRRSKRLIIITTPGHVGSSTLYQSIKGLSWDKDTRVYDFHSLDEHYNNKSKIPSRSARHVLQDVIRIMIKRKALKHKKIYVFTLIRDPIARALGGMFQGKGVFLNGLQVKGLEKSQYSLYCNKVKEIFLSGYLENTISWQFRFYRTELKKYWNFDMDTVNFQRGFGVQHGDGGTLVVITLENLDDALKQVIEDQFSFTPQIVMANTNRSDFYDYCKHNLKLERGFLQGIYADLLLTKAYGSQKVKELASRWTRQN